jgi:16S rRNA (guanine966-N2)-methyltransferase
MGLRIISGSLKGRRIGTPKGLLIRPTSDRLRETIFNIIGGCVSGRTVLDVFAGTGALGIEALSRGAESAVFIDSSPTAVRLIEANLRLCGVEGRARVQRCDLLRMGKCIRSAFAPFDLVFMDPPYHLHAVRQALLNLHQSGTLAQNALIVAEHSAEEQIAVEGAPFWLNDRRRYGKTVVSFLNYDIEDGACDTEGKTKSFSS